MATTIVQDQAPSTVDISPARPAPARRRRWTRRIPTVLSVILTSTALVSAIGAVVGALSVRMGPVRDIAALLLLPVPANLGYAAFVAILAAGVARRKRVAFWFLVVYVAVRLLLDLAALVLFGITRLFDAKNIDVQLDPVGVVVISVHAAVMALVLVGLKLSSGEFSARTQRASLPKALLTLVSLLALFTLAGWALLEAFPGTVPRGIEGLGYAAGKVIAGGTFNVQPAGRAPGPVNLVLGLLGAIALFATLYVLFRSQRAIASLSVDDERHIRALLAESGDQDSLGYFATRRDKAVVFSPTGKAAVTYREVAGVALASGDPLGPPEAWEPAIAAWLAHAQRYAWTPAVMGAGEQGATAYARAGLRVIELGDEAIVHVGQFNLDGRDMRPVRQAANRVQRAGYTLRIRRHTDITPEEMQHIIGLAARWRDTETERGYSMALGRLGDPSDGRCLLVEALDPQGQEAALLSFVPWGRAGLSLDLMRRDRSSENGLMEFMTAGLVEAAPKLGVDRIAMYFAVFRAVFAEGGRIGAGPVLRSWRWLLLFLSRWFQLESLYRSNVKYRPEWVPRFLCFDDLRDLAKVGLASAIAEGFVVVPSLRKLLRRAAPVPVEERPPLLDEPQAPPPTVDAAVPEQTRVRLAKLDALRAAGTDPYPPAFPRTHRCGLVRAAHAGLPPDTATGTEVTVAGRIVLLRDHGRLWFATLRDWSGDVQVMLTADVLDGWRSTVDIGDHVGVTGEVVTTKHGEVSVRASAWTLTAKCLHPLPDKHRGLSGEALVRQRHLDLIVNPAAREMLRVRSAAVHAVRTALIERGFLEVETPILQRVHGGANARPFHTHINAYNLPLYLRIAPELYLKRLAVGGVENVFELGRDFRNEGADATHNPEFTMLEAYQAYADYTDMRALARDLVIAAATAAFGAPVARDGFDLSAPWRAVTVHDAVSDTLGAAVSPDSTLDELRKLAASAGVPVHPDWGPGALVLEMYEHLVEGRTVAPTFYTDFPTEVSPLTRAHRTDPRVAERWDLVVFGMELGTAYTELIDPVEQRQRLTAQSLRAAGGDPEAMELDEDFLRTLEYAMPPTGGMGMGIDRLVMLLTGRTIRETLPFPLVKPR